MKVYSCPEEISYPEPDYANYDAAKEEAAITEHQAKLKAWLLARGFKGKNTGDIYRSQIADGFAVYMLADGPKSFLIHLPYGDGYNDPDAQYLPKKEVLRRIEADKRISALFAERRVGKNQ